MGKLNDVQKTVLALTSAVLFNTSVPFVDVDYSALKKESYDQAVFMLVYSAVASYLPESEQESWLDLSEKITAKNMTTDFEHSELHDLMTDNNIPYTTIKGSGAASYYPDPLKRMMGDVDFIIQKDHFSKAGRVLESAGFKRTDSDDLHFHFAYGRDLSTWEMHESIGGIPNDECGEKIREYLSDIIDKSVIYNYNGNTFRMPCVFHHGLILLIHTAEHLTSTGVGLRHLCDWAVFVNKIPDDEFAHLFEDKLKSVGLWNFACVLTHLSEKYLHIRHCSWLDNYPTPSDEFLEKMIVDIFKGGNFGTKDKQRLNQAKLITDVDTHKAGSRGAFRQLISSLNAKSKERLPIIKKAPILMPVGWIYTAGWYMVLLIQGKRPSINIKEMVKGAEERRAIYKEFKLFEVE